MVKHSPIQRKFRKLTASRLRNIALHYLSRYAASEASLRRVLQNRIRRACMQNDEFASDHEAQKILQEAINDIVEKHKKSGAINDEAFASMKVRSLRRSGGSARKIAMTLQQKGIERKLIDKALIEAEGEDPALREAPAAQAYAKRRRLGRWRSRLSQNRMDEEQKAHRKEKDYAAMARAGFSFDIIRQVLENKQTDDAYEQDWPE